MIQRKNDNKDYIYIRIPKERYKEIIENNKKVSTEELEEWRLEYQLKQDKKIESAKRANKIKRSRSIEKLYKALEEYFEIDLLSYMTRKEKKELTAYKLAKLAKVNYKTAKKFWDEHKIEEKWLKEFKKRKNEALKEFKLLELAKYYTFF